MKFFSHNLILLCCLIAAGVKAQVTVDISISAGNSISFAVNSIQKNNNDSVTISPGDSNQIVITNHSTAVYSFGIRDNQGRFLPCAIDIPGTSSKTLIFNSSGQFVSGLTHCAIQFPMFMIVGSRTDNNNFCKVNFKGAQDSAGSGTIQDTIIGSPLTGIPYYDAFNLADKRVGLTGKRQILKFYSNEDNSYDDNPFLKDSIKGMIQTKSLNSGGALVLPKVSLSSISGLDVTNIAQGVAQFMIERAKEELNVAFFNKLQKVIDEHPEVKALFPSTAHTMEHFLGYQYPQMLPALRVSFNEDMQKLPMHIDDLFQLPQYKELLKAFPEIRVGIQSIRIIESLEAESHPADLIKDFADLDEWKDSTASAQFRNMGNTLRLARILSESIRYKELNTTDSADTAWISPKQLRDLFTNKTVFNIYLGLVYQQVKNEQIRFVNDSGKPINFTEVMREHKSDVFLFQNLLREFITLTDQVEKERKEIGLKIKAGTKPSDDDYYNYINTAIDVVAYGFDIVKVFDGSFVADDYIRIAKDGNELYRHVYKKEYTSAVLSGLDIITATLELVGKDTSVFYNISALITLEEKDTALKSHVNALISFVKDHRKGNFSKSDIADIHSHIEAVLKRLDTLPDNIRITIDQNIESRIRKLCAFILSSKDVKDLQDLMPQVTKYGIFIAGMANAGTPEDVQALIEASALPAGSSSIKKSAAFNLSIQSYLGVYHQLRNTTNASTAWNSQMGLHGPIGIAASFGLGKGGSLSAFASIFDIGAIIDYQLTSDSVPGPNGTKTTAVTAESKIRLGQIVSPGLFLVYGAPYNLPLALGIGTQYGPGLNKIESNGNVVVNSPGWRPCVFLSVDIPLVTLVNSTKKKK